MSNSEDPPQQEFLWSQEDTNARNEAAVGAPVAEDFVNRLHQAVIDYQRQQISGAIRASVFVWIIGVPWVTYLTLGNPASVKSWIGAVVFALAYITPAALLMMPMLLLLIRNAVSPWIMIPIAGAIFFMIAMFSQLLFYSLLEWSFDLKGALIYASIGAATPVGWLIRKFLQPDKTIEI